MGTDNPDDKKKSGEGIDPPPDVQDPSELLKGIRSALCMNQGGVPPDGPPEGKINGNHAESGLPIEPWQRAAATEFPYESRGQFEIISEVRRLLGEHQLAAAAKAQKRLEDAGLIAFQRYDEIHTSGRHNFSCISERPTDFTSRFIKRTAMGPGSQVLELACGFGRDTLEFAKSGAKVIAADSSRIATDALRNHLQNQPYGPLVDVRTIDLRKVIENPFPGVTHVYARSGLHYFPPALLQHLLHKIAEFLPPDGYFGLSMKTINSNSANEYGRHLPLTKKEDGFHCSLDKLDKIFRIYPSEEKIQELVEGAGFRIIDMFTDHERGYERDDQVEEFRNIVAQPKKTAG